MSDLPKDSEQHVGIQHGSGTSDTSSTVTDLTWITETNQTPDPTLVATTATRTPGTIFWPNQISDDLGFISEAYDRPSHPLVLPADSSLSKGFTDVVPLGTSHAATEGQGGTLDISRSDTELKRSAASQTRVVTGSENEPISGLFRNYTPTTSTPENQQNSIGTSGNLHELSEMSFMIRQLMTMVSANGTEMAVLRSKIRDLETISLSDSLAPKFQLILLAPLLMRLLLQL